MAHQKEFQEDFIDNPPNLPKYIQRLQKWRGRYERHLDSRPRAQPLDLLSHYLAEFQYGKTDEIEVPGQYTEVR
jgi:transformation/transcription domain-associated protein